LPKLRLLCTTGMRNAAIDLESARKNNVVVCGTGGGGNSTLEHIWAVILATARNIIVEHQNVRNGLWQTTVPCGLSGKTLGLIGVGKLGTQTAQIAKAFGMKVIGWSPNLTPERAAEAGVEFASKERLFRSSDIVSVHLVLSASTRHLIGSQDLALMKPSAFLINTSRGPIVHEEALLQAMKNKTIAGAGLDVFDIEPLPVDHPLRGLDNTVLSPHLGYVSDDNYKVFWKQTVENIVSFLDGNPQRVLS